jgi:hypothetical protein
MNSGEHRAYREYRVSHVDAKGRTTITIFREWLDPKTNKQRQDNAVVQKYKKRFESIATGLTPKQRRNRIRRLRKARKDKK